MNPSRKLEKALKQHELRNTNRAGHNYFTKYVLLKERLVNVEYTQAMAGFRGGNDHGPQHIERVLDYLDALLGPKPISKLSAYELFLTAMSILYHDVGILLGRKTHAGKSDWLLSLEKNDYVMDVLDKEFMAIAVHSHSSNKKIEESCKQYPQTQSVRGQKVRIRTIAALVRLADELDEDQRRAPASLQQKMDPKGIVPAEIEDIQRLPPESQFFWAFNQRIRGVEPDSQRKTIKIEMRFQPEDATSEIVLGSHRRNFVEASIEKILKINQERIYCNGFLPDAMQFPALEITLLPVVGQNLWNKAWVRTIEGSTTLEEFIKEIPEGVRPKTLTKIEPTAKSQASDLQPSERVVQTDAAISSTRIAKGDILAAAEEALTRLLSLQYPWGEWSDHRSALESEIAERYPHRGPEGPKPNVARTMFAVEALKECEFFEDNAVQALKWMQTGVRDGWYYEWTSSQADDSETSLLSLSLRSDVRHTSQVASALIKWHRERDPISTMVQNISRVYLKDSGFWPETPGSLAPKLLATVYAVEALGHITAGSFRLPLKDLVDATAVNAIWDSFRAGLAALHREADRSGGLLGGSTGHPTPYLTGIALMRLAPLAHTNRDILDLAKKMTDALVESWQVHGYEDLSVSPNVREETRKRTTLRVAAGLSRAKQVSISVNREILNHVISLVKSYMNNYANQLDSPDFACAFLSLSAFDDGIVSNMQRDRIKKESQAIRCGRVTGWIASLDAYLTKLSEGRRLSHPGYDQLAGELLQRRKLLTAIVK